MNDLPRLKIVFRDLSVLRRTRFFTVSDSHRGFAERILARYGVTVESGVGLTLVFRRLPVPVQNTFYSSTQQIAAPRITLKLASASYLETALPDSETHHFVRELTRAVQMVYAERDHTTAEQRLIERLIRQVIRQMQTHLVERETDHQKTVDQRREIYRQQVFQQQGQLIPAVRQVLVRVSPAEQSKSPPPVIHKSPAAAPPAPIDVNQLTDQVIRAIDSRIIAMRERMGR